MPITLTITDAQDGTGTATIAGSTGTNTLYQATWDGSMGTLSFSSVGSRSGDGTIALSGAGYFIWRLDNLASGTTTVVIVYQNITTIDLAVYDKILDKVRTDIVSLSLSGIASVDIAKKWLPRDVKNVDVRPSIIIAPVNFESYPNQTTGLDYIGYPVLVAMVDKLNKDYTANFNRNLLWRQKIFRKFRYQGLAGLSEVINCEPEPRATIDPKLFDANYFHSAAVLRFITQEPRGQ